jgi:hypothetical protein
MNSKSRRIHDSNAQIPTVDDDPAAAGVVLFLLPRERLRPRSAIEEPRFKREPSASAMWKREKAENPR